jgi:mRNA-degrading endonuclease RelE of RelBE toxin-antitoxin system
MRSVSAEGHEGNCGVPTWNVETTGKAVKQKEELPSDIADTLLTLVKELQRLGPVRSNWPHYGKIKGLKKNVNIRHCHLNQGRPTYVAAWKLVDKKNKKMELIHVGTHEKTDYGGLG